MSDDNSRDVPPDANTGTVLPFRPRRAPDPEAAAARRLLAVSDELDAVIIRHLRDGTIDARDLAGLMAHRLGSLMRHIDRKDALWDVCRRILEMQARIDSDGSGS